MKKQREPKQKYISPCCRAPSLVRAVSLAEGTMALRCTECAQLRLKPLGQPEPGVPALRLIVSR